ncbi:MAG: hypothetical protein M9962_04435 [Oligoflexia bacterium]|nr:hypothetical protein [Oligoflexia bacterium]
MKLIIITLFLFSIPSLAHQEVYYCKSDNKNIEPVRLFLYDHDLIRVKFVNLDPDRYYSGKKIKIQFATKKGPKEELDYQVVKSSFAEIEYRLCGGPALILTSNQNKISYSCSFEDKNRLGCKSKE